MYYMAKSLQLLGILSVFIGVIIKYPKLMDPKLFLASLIIFGSGMAVEKYLLKSVSYTNLTLPTTPYV